MHADGHEEWQRNTGQGDEPKRPTAPPKWKRPAKPAVAKPVLPAQPTFYENLTWGMSLAEVKALIPGLSSTSPLSATLQCSIAKVPVLQCCDIVVG